MDEPALDEIGIWTQIKLEIVQKYAKSYSTILDGQERIRRHLYIDAFAGLGVHKLKATGNLVPGSPTIALDVTPPFSEYHFIDLDEQRVENLQRISEERENVKVHKGDCNSLLLDTVFPLCRYEDYSRALCLLDPY